MTADSEPKETHQVSPRRRRSAGTKPVPKKAHARPIIECPPELGPAAKQEWDRIIADLTPTGMLKTFDRAALAAFCEAYALWIEAVENVRKYGAVMKSPSGYPVQSPYLSIATRQVDTMLRIATEFGFTPASRGQRSMITRTNSQLLEPEVNGDELKGLTEFDGLPALKW